MFLTRLKIGAASSAEGKVVAAASHDGVCVGETETEKVLHRVMGEAERPAVARAWGRPSGRHWAEGRDCNGYSGGIASPSEDMGRKKMKMFRRAVSPAALTALLLVRAAGRADPPKPDVPLAKAVREFNEAAKKDPVGKDQPALTTEEVEAAICAWKLERGRRPPASDEVFAAFQTVAATGSLPPGARLCSTTGWVTTDYEFDVWWVDLKIPDGKDRFYAFRVRDRKLASRPVQKR